MIWIAGGSRADQVGMNHPATPQPEDRIQPSGKSMHLSVRGRVHVRAAIGPCPEKRTVLLQQNSVLNERKREQKICQAAGASSVLGICMDCLPPTPWRFGS